MMPKMFAPTIAGSLDQDTTRELVQQGLPQDAPQVSCTRREVSQQAGCQKRTQMCANDDIDKQQVRRSPTSSDELIQTLTRNRRHNGMLVRFVRGLGDVSPQRADRKPCTKKQSEARKQTHTSLVEMTEKELVGVCVAVSMLLMVGA